MFIQAFQDYLSSDICCTISILLMCLSKHKDNSCNKISINFYILRISRSHVSNILCISL